MTCTEVEALIHKELDGELLAGEADALREHVGTCPRCAGLRTGLHKLAATARGLAVSPTSTPDRARRVVERVTRSLRRRRQLRLALVASLAVAAGLLLLVLSTWPGAPTAKPVPPVGTPNLVQRPATGQRAPSPADFVSLSLDEGLTWVQDAWQRTQEEVTGLAQAASLPEEGAVSEGEGSWWEEVSATGDALREITREVSDRILPTEPTGPQASQRSQSRRPPLYETSDEQQNV